jgi:hypothetical protein
MKNFSNVLSSSKNYIIYLPVKPLSVPYYNINDLHKGYLNLDLIY